MSHAPEDLFNPWLMRSAWRKVKKWINRGEYFDLGERRQWEMHPWQCAEELAQGLALCVETEGKSGYQPDDFPLIPYPKKGDVTRHYVAPSIRDQVAFTAFTTLLGPFLEARMPNVSMGNRLFRPRVPRRHNGVKRWYRAPFSLRHDSLYDSYSVGHGLFRRILQWKVNSGLLNEYEMRQINRREENLEDPRLLPYHGVDFSGFCKTNPEVYAIELDLRVAFPSVCRETLSEQIEEMMKGCRGQKSEGKWGLPSFPELCENENSGPFRSWLEPDRKSSQRHPWHILVSDADLREKTAKALGSSLEKIEYSFWPEPKGWCNEDLFNPGRDRPADCDPEELRRRYDTMGLWRPDTHLTQELLEENRFGLPTGLTASGLLLNVALNDVDREMCSQFERLHQDAGSERAPFIYLRFADDIILLSPKRCYIKKAWEHLHDKLLKSTAHNFRANTEKVKPRSLRRILKSHNDKEEEAETDWQQEELCFLPGEKLTRTNHQSFTTELVREMSDITMEAIDEQFASAGITRLEQLLNMVAKEEDEQEVKPDTVTTFAVNRLARSTWPIKDTTINEQPHSKKGTVHRILLGAERAIRRHPWRFNLWRAIIVLAIRASAHLSDPDNPDEDPKKWMCESVLPLIGWCGDWEKNSYNEDMAKPPRTKCESVKERRKQHRILRASFHRAQFLRQWAYNYLTLRRLAAGELRPSLGNRNWTRFLTGDDARCVAKIVGCLDDLVRTLYPEEHVEKRQLWWWETEALNEAVMAHTCPDIATLCTLGQPAVGSLQKSKLYAERFPWLAQVETLHRENNVRQDENQPEPPSVFWLDKLAPIADCRGAAPTPRGDSRYEIVEKLAPELINPASEKDTALLAALLNSHKMRGALQELAHRLKSTQPPPPANSNDIWASLRKIDAYSSIRRFMMANGVITHWRMFAHWFSDIDTADDPACTSNSLRGAMYSFADGPDTPEALVGQLELPISVARSIICTIMSRVNQSSRDGEEAFVSPDTVLLEREAYCALAESRKTQTSLHENSQIDFDEEIIDKYVSVLKPENSSLVQDRLPRLREYHRAPHPLFLYPEVLLDKPVNPRNSNYQNEINANEWRTAMLAIWLITGGEHNLHRIQGVAPWQVPMGEWSYFLARHFIDSEFAESLDKWLGISRVDTEITFRVADVDCMSKEAVKIGNIHIQGRNEAHKVKIDKMQDSLVIRVMQGAQKMCMRHLLGTQGPPNEDIAAFRAVSVEMAEMLNEARNLVGTINPGGGDLAVFPEFYVPRTHVRGLIRYVQETGIGIIAGLTPYELPRVVPTTDEQRQKGKRLLVNEAVVIIPEPDCEEKDGVPGGAHLRDVLCFRVRKPYASAIELGLVHALNAGRQGQTWTFAPGLQWTRFLHPRWGGFSAIICSDLLDTFAWDWLRGRIQHLFVVAHNEDIPLFDQLTWTRGYELFANVVSVNHGGLGGSVVWSPKSRHEKKKYHVHGSKVASHAPIEIPVKSLAKWQRCGFETSVCQRSRRWRRTLVCEPAGITSVCNRRCQDEDTDQRKFKTPPPGYRLNSEFKFR